MQAWGIWVDRRKLAHCLIYWSLLNQMGFLFANDLGAEWTFSKVCASPGTKSLGRAPSPSARDQVMSQFPPVMLHSDTAPYHATLKRHCMNTPGRENRKYMALLDRSSWTLTMAAPQLQDKEHTEYVVTKMQAKGKQTTYFTQVVQLCIICITSSVSNNWRLRIELFVVFVSSCVSWRGYAKLRSQHTSQKI